MTEIADKGLRAVCLIAKDDTATVCGNWDTGKLRYGWRSDASAAWSYGDEPPKAAEPKKGVFASMLSSLADLIDTGTSGRKR